eukprot:9285011-Alexandrium_andersonii.AAC.1
MAPKKTALKDQRVKQIDLVRSYLSRRRRICFGPSRRSACKIHPEEDGGRRGTRVNDSRVR